MNSHSLLASFGAMAVLATAIAPSASADITLEYLSTFNHQGFAVGAAEIAAYDRASKRLFVVNAQAQTVDVLDIADPTAPVKVGTIDATSFGGAANSVSASGGVIAVAIEASVKQDPGTVAFFDGASLGFLSSVTVGALPDMITFTPDGRYALVANEGEPNDAYTVDPEGSVSVIDLAGGAASLTPANVRTAGFSAFNGLNRNKAFGQEKIRAFGPGATVAQDFEPEYIAVSADSKTAWVTLQEANAIAVIDIASATVKEVRGLGAKNHDRGNNGFGSSNALDPSDRDGGIKIAQWPVRGLYMPDAVAAFTSGGQTFLALANEGDSREYAGFNELTRIGASDFPLDPATFPNAAFLRGSANLGRLRATKSHGDSDGDGDFDEIYTLGGRSFSIRGVNGQLLWDSGDQFEKITAQANPAFFNSTHDANRFDDRSDDKGPEPEGLAVGIAYGRQYAFVGLERVSGVMVYDLSTPTTPAFVGYVNRRDFTKNVSTPEAGDLGPEGLLFINAEDSPTGVPLLVVSNEISGTTSVFAVMPAE